MSTVLKLTNINKAFSGVPVLKNVSFSVEEGSCFGLVGANGAGKSTLMNIIGGIYERDSGEIMFAGEDYKVHSPLEASDKGIAFIHQELNLFTNLTVAENIYIEKFPLTKAGTVNWKKIKGNAEKQFKEMNCEIDINKKVADLSMGQRQLVEIAKAFAKNASLIIFDEPTTSLSRAEKEVLFRLIGILRAQKKTIIYISHILEDLFSLCDEIAVLRDGIIVRQDKVGAFSLQSIATDILGKEVESVYPEHTPHIGEEIFRVDRLNMGTKVKDVSFSLRKGEIIGFYGLMGAGRTETMQTIFGVTPKDSGEIYFNNERMEALSPEECIKRKIAYVTENRREEGLLVPKPVTDNLSLVTLEQFKKKSKLLDQSKIYEACKSMIDKLSIKTTYPKRQSLDKLSGGNQQKVVIGKWLLLNPELFILDEPTRGVDVGAKFDIYNIIQELANIGSSIVFISSELEELMGVCDRILVMRTGSIVADVTREDFDAQKITEFALGG